jgi:hypothetical protein
MLRQRFCVFGGGRALAPAPHALKSIRASSVEGRSRPVSLNSVIGTGRSLAGYP